MSAAKGSSMASEPELSTGTSDASPTCPCDAEFGYPVACRQPVEREGDYCPACRGSACKGLHR